MDNEVRTRALVADLERRFPTIDPLKIEAIVRPHVDRLTQARVTVFAWVLAERYARDDLQHQP